MTPQEIRNITEKALEDIAASEPAQVRSARRGVVAAVQCLNGSFVFRREGPTIHLERWMTHRTKAVMVKHFPLPLDLQERVGQMLDNLP